MGKAVQHLLNSSTPINVTIVNGGYPDGFFNGVSWSILSSRYFTTTMSSLLHFVHRRKPRKAEFLSVFITFIVLIVCGVVAVSFVGI